jgi:hypothetical protein
LQLASCQDCAAIGEHDAAEHHFERALAQLESRNVTGVLIGVAYEIGARVALARADLPLIRLRLARCDEHYRMASIRRSRRVTTPSSATPSAPLTEAARIQPGA